MVDSSDFTNLVVDPDGGGGGGGGFGEGVGSVEDCFEQDIANTKMVSVRSFKWRIV